MADVAFKISPRNLIDDFGYMESWSKGTSVPPDGWYAVGTAGAFARESSTVKFGTYAMKLTSGSTGAYAGEYIFDVNNRKIEFEGIEYTSLTFFAGRTVKFGMRVKCSTASKARIYVDDGIGRSNSSYHTGSGDWEFLEIEHQVDTSFHKIHLGVEVAADTVVAYFDGGIFVEGDTIFTDFRDTNIFVKEDEWSPSLSFKYGSFSIVRHRGTKIRDVRASTRTLRIKVQVHNTTLSSARSIFDGVVKACRGGKRDILLEDDRLTRGVLSKIPSMKFYADLRVYMFSLDFAVEDPYLRYIAAKREQTGVSGSPHSFNFEVGGSVENNPVFLFVPPSGITLSSLTLENLTTGRRFSYSDSVAPGTTLLVDTENLEVLNDSVDGISYFTGDLTDMYLKPETNYMKFTGTDGISIFVDFTEKFI